MEKMTSLIIKKDKSSIITSILFFILGICLVVNPGGMVKFITYIIGLIFAVYGSIKLYNYYKAKETVSNIQLTLGITSIVIGIIMFTFAYFESEVDFTLINGEINYELTTVIGIIIMFCNGIIEFVIRLIMGGFILANGLNKLIVALNSKDTNDKWQGLLAIAIILIIVGLYVILKSNIVFSTVGIVLIIYSSIDLISYIMYPKNKDIIK